MHIKNVVIYIPSIWIYPCLTISVLQLVDDTILPVPIPDSFEKIPLCMPIKNPDIKPAKKDLKLKASFIISINIWGILLIFKIKTIKANKIYIIVIIGTITVENLVICFNPPYIIINVIIERTVAIKKTFMLVFTKLLVIVLDCIPQKNPT